MATSIECTNECLEGRRADREAGPGGDRIRKRGGLRPGGIGMEVVQRGASGAIFSKEFHDSRKIYLPANIF